MIYLHVSCWRLSFAEIRIVVGSYSLLSISFMLGSNSVASGMLVSEEDLL